MSQKQLWSHDHFYRELFGKQIELTNPRVTKLRKQLNSLPDQDFYTIVSYGSLMNLNAVYTAFDKVEAVFPCSVEGYERTFNMGNTKNGTFLNIQHSGSGEDLLCVGISISAKDMPEYLMREGLYELIHVEYYNFESKKKAVGYTVISFAKNIGIEPQLNYVHSCLTGIAEIHGYKGIENFLLSKCYCPRHHREVTLGEWMENISLKDYMTKHKYLSR
jgi:hypothetical protein